MFLVLKIDWLLAVIVFVHRLFSTHNLSRRHPQLFVVFPCPFHLLLYIRASRVSLLFLRFVIATHFRSQHQYFAGTTSAQYFISDA